MIDNQDFLGSKLRLLQLCGCFVKLLVFEISAHERLHYPDPDEDFLDSGVQGIELSQHFL